MNITNGITPLPWSACVPLGTVWTDDENTKIATVEHLPWNNRGSRASEEEANTRYIVAAANCLPDCVEALRNVLGWYESSDVSAMMCEKGEQAEYHRTLREARAALAKVQRELAE